jgi:signal transduction histidine kinase
LNAELFTEIKLLLGKEKLSAENEKNIKSLLDNAIENMSKINHHSTRADGIVKSMMLHSANSSGEKQLTNINLLAEEYLKLSYHGMKAKDPSFMAYLQTGFDENLEEIKVIPQHIGRVLLNLFNNSFYSITKKRKLVRDYEPTVFISTKRVKKGIEVKVRDNGIGMNPKDVYKVYQPFYTTKPSGEGIGLGLSLSYEIITKGHGGEMKAETREGEFAEFSFILPASEYYEKMQRSSIRQEANTLCEADFFTI